MSFLAVLNRLDVLIDRVEKLIAAVTGIPIGAPPTPPTPPIPLPPTVVVVNELKRNNRYHIFDIDLTKAHTDEPLGIGDLIKKQGIEFCNFMLILKVDSAFTYKVNDKAASVCDAALGDTWEDFDIAEIYYTNAALAGVGRIHVEYRVG